MPKRPPKSRRDGVRRKLEVSSQSAGAAAAASGASRRDWGIAGGVLAALLLVLHGRVLAWPFLSDDFVFLAASRSVGQLFTSFDVYSNYFRPIGRELYFLVGYLVARNHPLPYHLLNFLILVGVVVMVVGLAHRLAGPRAGLLAGVSYALLYSHRMVLAWVSCAQDLLAACLALVSTHALLSGHRWRAGLWFLAALLSKESVAAFPLVYALWRALDAPQTVPWRQRARTAARESAPLWAATAAWMLIVLAVRLSRHAWAKGPGTVLADVSLSVGSLWEGMRSALLSYVALEQPWSAIARALVEPRQSWVTLALALALVVGLASWSRTFTPPLTAPARNRTWLLGALWAVIGALPIALAGHHYSAYYVTFSGVGFALLLGSVLSGAAPVVAVAPLALATALGQAANRVDLFNFARMEPVAGVSYITTTRLDHERLYLDSLHVAMDRAGLPQRRLVYVAHAPHYSTFMTMYGRAPRVWFDDPTIEIKMISEYRPDEPRPHAFLRFDPATRGFDQVPNELMDTSLAADAAMAAGRYAEALARMDRALALLPAQGLTPVRLDLLNNRGSACLGLGDTTEARTCWRQAVSIQPTFASPALNLALLDLGSGRPAAARETLERLLSFVPESADALELLVHVERELGDLPAAQVTLARLAAVDPVKASRLEEVR